MNIKIYVPKEFRAGMLNTTLRGGRVESLQEHIESQDVEVHYIDTSNDVTELNNLRVEVRLLRNLWKGFVQQEIIDYYESMLDILRVS
jgi:CHAD domain-containing protein